MLNLTQLEDILQSRETPILDFKGRMYDLSSPRGENGKGYLDLIKDILAMSNTPRSQPAYLIIGVVNKPNSPNIVKGVVQQTDDNDIQNLLKQWCDPVPQALYYDMNYKGKIIGIIEISLDQERGPFFIKSNLTNEQYKILHSESKFLKQGELYFRRGTTNDSARQADYSHVSEWFTSHGDNHWQTWDVFKRACHYFVPSRHYILIASSLNEFPSEALAGLSHIDWTAVIDFDPYSDSKGLLHIFDQLKLRRNLSRVVKGEFPPVHPDLGLYWFFAQGLEGRHQSLVTPSGEWRKWRGIYGSELDRQFRHLAEAIAPGLVTFVVLWYDQPLARFLQTTIDATTCFVDAEFVVVSDTCTNLETFIGQEFSPVFVGISVEHLGAGLRAEFRGQDHDQSDEHMLPSRSGAPIPLPVDKERWLEEEFELVHLGVGTVTPDQDPASQEFLRGAVISWVELSLGKDAERDKTNAIEQRIRQDLSRRETVRIQLYHRPGAGGTTVSRRILWNLHTLYPCAVLRRSDPEHIVLTAERLAYIYSITTQPILLLIDSAQIAERLVNDLYDTIRSKGTPVVMLLTSRRFEAQTERTRSFQLDLQLSPSELPRFVEKFKNDIPGDRTTKIKALLNTSQTHEQTAFYFGLTAYESNFRGIKSYVLNRLMQLTPQQVSILGYLSLAHYYAQRGVPTQAFVELLGLPTNREVKFEKIFQNTEETLV